MAILHKNEDLTEPDPGSILIIERTFEAPRERVWAAWTNPDLAMRWWGPKGFTTPTARISLRVGGQYLFCMRSPEGRDFWSTGFYREIVPYDRLVATDSFSDEKGNVVPATRYGMSKDFPLELLLTLTFEERGGKTSMKLRHAGFPSRQDLHGARQGWNESFDKLAALLASG